MISDAVIEAMYIALLGAKDADGKAVSIPIEDVFLPNICARIPIGSSYFKGRFRE